MAILIILPEKQAEEVRNLLLQKIPDEQIFIWPEIGAAENIEIAVTWNHSHGIFGQFPNLKLIASYGAGVDHIFADPDLPKEIPVSRFVADSLSRQMADYVAGAILAHRLRLVDYREYQAAGHWTPHAPRAGNRVTILGLGELGSRTAEQLTRMDFEVSGWSRSRKSLDNCTCYAGRKELGIAVNDADYVVCLLPLTAETRGILNRNLFNMMKEGAYLINAARGDHLVVDDLLDALYQGRLAGACLDVFEIEPLPGDSPLWRHPRILITPHIASISRSDDMADYILENYQALRGGTPLANLVDSALGY
ncbi:glyoxylate/hydroxypyruvate reductase A [Emcibacter sp.]|uniref:2-hydroxyacid dehydrogenase n=1 Tax=Emcibacter sp. TaxID=1979954 RepID=UPI002AA64B03|nr:glyoxylate/hydroxypyruvate reductase A [Emcibacter sp.]